MEARRESELEREETNQQPSRRLRVQERRLPTNAFKNSRA